MVDFSGRVYCVLLLLYPAGFRQHFGDDMAQLFRDCCREALHERGYAGIVLLWLRTLFDLAITALMQQIDSLIRKDDPLMSTTMFDQQLVSTFNLMSRMLRAGYNVMQTLQHIASTAPEPTASQIRQMIEDVKNGANWFEAMGRMQARLNSIYFGQIMDVMARQLEEGGNLADRLDTKLAEIRPESGEDGWSENVPLDMK
jgi:Flp pilus assembly protein TadB